MKRGIRGVVALAACAGTLAGIQPAQAQTAGTCVFEGLTGSLSPSIQNALPDLDDFLVDVERGGYMFHTSANSAVVCAGVFGGRAGYATMGPGPLAGDLSIESNGYFDSLVCGTGFMHDLDGLQTTLTGTNRIGAVPGQQIGGGTISLSGAGYEIPYVAGSGPILIGSGASLSETSEYMFPDIDPGNNSAGGYHPYDGAPGNGAIPKASDVDFLNPTPQIHGLKTSPYTGVGVVEIIPGTGIAVPPARPNCVLPAPMDWSSGRTPTFSVAGFFVATG